MKMKMRTEKKRSKTMAEPSHLPDHILFSRILSKLPVKSLYRFKSVSKLWNATISDDPYFAKSHLSRAKQISTSSILGVLCLKVEGKNMCDYIFKKDDHSELFRFRTNYFAKLAAHCNGLFCFRSDSRLEICNPCTHELLYHPLPMPHKSGYAIYGFGFDPLEKEYKLIEIVVTLNDCRCMISTFGTRGSSSWKDITGASCLSLSAAQVINQGQGLYINGKIYWFFCQRRMFLAFDVHCEKFESFDAHGPVSSLNANFPGKGYCLFLMEWEGCVCLALSNTEFTAMHLYRYETHHDWKLLEVSTADSRRGEAGSQLGVKGLKHVPDEYIEMFIPEGQDGRFWYDPGSKMAKCLALPSWLYGPERDAFTYHFENIFSLKTSVKSGTSQAGYVKNRKPGRVKSVWSGVDPEFVVLGGRRKKTKKFV